MKTIPKKVTVSAGAKLVAIARGYPKHLPEPGGDDPETFLIYQLLGKYVGTAGWYGVNPWTGAVWDLMSCEELHTARLYTEQKKIKALFKKNELKEYSGLSSLRPYRMSDLEPCE